MPVTYTSAAAFRLLLASVLFVLLIAPHCGADVFVLTNRTRQTVQVQISPESQAPYLLRLASGEVRPIRSDEPLQVAFDSGAERAAYVLDANSAYYFGVARDGRLSMHRIGLGDDESTAKGRPLPPTPEPDESFVIDVMLLVDDDEPTRPILWEKKLRDRAAKASRLLTKHAGVALRVVGVSTWNSNNSTTDFDKSLREFEKQIDPSPARLAIGFTSQYEVPRGRIHLGGTRGPMARHIMIREWSRHVSEQERLELLLHELGHFLGATHSPERDSVMRPVLGDRQARVRGFDVRFDAVNTLIISMVAEEMQRRGVDRFSDLSDGTRRRLAQVYSTLAKAMPYDPSSSRFVARTKARRLTSQSGQIRQIMQAIVRAAKRGDASGDALTESYVQAAAAEAQLLPADAGGRAMLIALGLTMDDTNALRTLPLTRRLATAAESSKERATRLRVLGKPTIEGRADLAKHFLASACLTAASGPEVADQLGLTKEAADAQGGTGFSFADMAANRAGIRFAEAVLAGRAPLPRLADSFRLLPYMPSIKDLPEGLQNEELIAQYGGPGDERFEQQLAEIDRRIDALPAYMTFSPSLWQSSTPSPAQR